MEQLRLSYIARLPRVARALREALEARPVNDEVLRATCHRLRGSAGAYGLADLSALAARAEEASEPDLAAAAEQVITAISEIAHPPPAGETDADR